MYNPEVEYLRLCQAIEFGDINMLTKILEEPGYKHDVNYQPPYNDQKRKRYEHILNIVARSGNIEMMKLLVKAGLNTECRKYSPMYFAAIEIAGKGDLPMLKYLNELSPNCIYGGNPFCEASTKYKFDVIDFFMQEKVSINYFNTPQNLIEDKANIDKSYKMFVKIWPGLDNFIHGCVVECIKNNRTDVLDFIKDNLTKKQYLEFIDDYKRAVNSNNQGVELTFKHCFPGSLSGGDMDDVITYLKQNDKINLINT